MTEFTYPEISWEVITLTLRFEHSALVPEAISEVLNLTPTRITHPGESAFSGDGFWIKEFSGVPNRKVNPIPATIDALYARREAIQRIARSGVETRLSIASTISNGETLVLNEDEIQKLAELEIPITLACHAPN
ncbi:DUF4279 domain-containing protein [Nocardia camponoti]|uniref:DUF4279 domain-containing protein n=1 Tax=Nocardia camponoti TaxID=1616106 RepID=A0A917V982_9NOCA|nr:hypothetical protein GCM10011591_26500 [Nocardia camponoti]